MVRPANADDLRLLARMLGEAVAWRPDAPAPDVEAVLTTPGLAHYLEGWPRADDFGLVAADHQPLGAAWWRKFRAGEPGYGYVADDIPELAVAVDAPWRGQGVGTALLESLVASAASKELRALSLSVARENPAARLYRRLGFRTVGQLESALTMVLEL